MNNKIKVVNISEVSENYEKAKLRLYNIEYLNKEGKEKIWTIASRNTLNQLVAEVFENGLNVDGVAMYMIHEPTNKLVLLREFRSAINDYIYTIPGGMIEKGEDVYSAAKRELKEETGLELLELTEITPPLYSAVGITNEKVVIAYGKCIGEISTIGQSNNEDAEILLIDVEDAKEIIENAKHKEEKVAARTYLLLKEFILMYGKKKKPTKVTCIECLGTGWIKDTGAWNMDTSHSCNECDGSGYIGIEKLEVSLEEYEKEYNKTYNDIGSIRNKKYKVIEE